MEIVEGRRREAKGKGYILQEQERNKKRNEKEDDIER